MNPLSTVESWLYMLQTVTDDLARQIAASDAGLVVIDSYDWMDSANLMHSPAEVDALRGANDKLVVSYLSIGEAEDYRAYWQSRWDSNPPGFMASANPEWEGNYKVRYWDAQWQRIIFDYVDRIVDAGFNGLYLDIVDAYQYWEQVAPGLRDYEEDMVDFVAAIEARAEARLRAAGDTRDFVIIGQNAEELAANDRYTDIVDGMAKEDLRFYYRNGSESGFSEVPDTWFGPSVDFLEMAEAKGVEVFVVEYLTPQRQTQYADSLDSLIDYLNGAEIPLYVAESRALDRLYAQPDGIGFDAALPPAGAVIEGTDGSDRLEGTEGDDIAKLGLGNDRIVMGGGDDVAYGWRGRDAIFGGDGDDVIEGNFDSDRLEGGGGSDRVVGGPGADTFVFKRGLGEDRILDFRDGSDRLEFIHHADVDGMADLVITQVGDHVVIRDPSGGRIVLADTALSAIDPSDFLF